MVNPFQEVNWRPGREERRAFATSLAVGFPGVAAVLLVVGRWHGGQWSFGFPLAVGGVGTALGLLLWIVPPLARPFYVGWYAVACCAGFLVGNAVLATIYLLMLTPLGLARRAIGRRSFSKGFDRNATTYWSDTRTSDDPERYFRQY